jgi:hydrogenase nickel incorporation protein HypA/HybF
MCRSGRRGPSGWDAAVSIVEIVHELSICSSIADIVTRHAAGRTVQVINVRAGQLRQIVPDTLVYCWGLVSAGTPLAGSRISVEPVPARIRCRSCGQVTDVGELPVFTCGGCGGFAVEVVSGEEFLITSLELVALQDDKGSADGEGDG